MVFTGVNEVNGEVTKWEVENSWGNRGENNGYYMMTDSWFTDYVYEVLIHKNHLSKEELGTIEGDEEVVLPPWDPMGALA